MGARIRIQLRPGEHVLWRGSPIRRSAFLRTDPAWMRSSLKLDAVRAATVTAAGAVLSLWTGQIDSLVVEVVAVVVVVAEALKHAEPFLWRYLTLHRTSYYVTNQRVVWSHRRRSRATPLTEVDRLLVHEEQDGSGYVRINRRIMPDGFIGNTVGELIHVAGVREVVNLLSTLTGQTPINID